MGARTLDYANAIAVLYVYPFIIALLAPFVLGERGGAASWIGVVGGFCGVLLVARPTSDGLADTGAAWVLLCGASVALQMILNRKLGATIDPMLTSTIGALVAVLIMTPIAPFVWETPTHWQLALLGAIGAMAAFSQTLFAFAFARTPAAELVPFTYSEIIAGVVIGFALFGTLPDAVSWIGIAAIAASGLLVAHAQRGGRLLRRQTKF